MASGVFPNPVPVETGSEISFGSFRLQLARQLLLQGDKPVRIGGRALDILILLVERAGSTVSKDELFARVWPNVTVEEGNLTTQIALLRKVLNDGRDGARYVISVPGRGYRFVAPVSRSTPSPVTSPGPRLPSPASRVIGREDVVLAVANRLDRRRFVTIVGPGGIGKTTIAVVIANETAASYEHGVYFIDLAPVSTSVAISSVVASALGLAVVSDDPTSELIAFLNARRLLIVLDSCEHVLEAAALLAEAVLRGSAEARILATSREPLRAEGETVYHLAALEAPPERGELTAAQALAFPAVALFVERAAAGGDFEITDENAATVSGICRKLDGMALAIELAAGRVNTFGLRELATQLDDRFRLLMQGRRTALPRHRTLRAALDWSYQFLEDAEQKMLRCAATFVGIFTLEAAQAVASNPTGSLLDVDRVVADLISKSLISINFDDSVPLYRLLDTTRAYAGEKLVESGEFEGAARRHAEYYKGLLERAGGEAEAKSREDWLATYGRQIDNIRKALDWTFSEGGDAPLALALTEAALPLWMHLSLMNECRTRVAQALATLSSKSIDDPRLELKFNHALGAVLLNIEASGTETSTALAKALRIAEELDDTDFTLRVLWCQWCDAHNRGAFREAMDLANRFTEVSTTSRDPVDPLTGVRMQGFTVHFLGDQDAARQKIEYMLANYVAPVHRAHIIRFQFDQKITANNFLVSILWLQGFADQALALNAANIEEARAFDHTMSLCNALAKGACLLTLMANDLEPAERYVEMLLARSARDGLAIWNSWGNCYKAILLIKQGHAREGVELLQSTLGRLPENRFSLRFTWVFGEYAEGLRLAGRITDGLQMIDKALAMSDQDDERWCIAELLRIKGELLLSQGGAAAEQDAEQQFQQSLDWARRQKVLSWELRTSLSLARLHCKDGRPREASDLLMAIYGRFNEGFGTADLQQAKSLIDALMHR
jgi:predicted ATPase/DNA-binding winged helix-turn-helix (wHTH) protein